MIAFLLKVKFVFSAVCGEVLLEERVSVLVRVNMGVTSLKPTANL